MEKTKMIPGLPETVSEAMAQIEDIESSSSADWLPLDSVLAKIGQRYEVYAC